MKQLQIRRYVYSSFYPPSFYNRCNCLGHLKVFNQYSFQLNSTKIMEWMDTRTVDTKKTKYQYAKWQMSRELRHCIRNEKLLLEIWENVQFVSTGGIALPRWIRYSKTRSIFLHCSYYQYSLLSDQINNHLMKCTMKWNF